MVDRCNFTPSTEARGGFICGYLYLRPLFPECSLTITDNDLLLVVSRGSTRSEKTQIADLPFRYHEADLEGEIHC